MDVQPQEVLPGTLLIGRNIGDTLLLAKGTIIVIVDPNYLQRNLI